jgi:hypothetical protein
MVFVFLHHHHRHKPSPATPMPSDQTNTPNILPTKGVQNIPQQQDINGNPSQETIELSGGNDASTSPKVGKPQRKQQKKKYGKNTTSEDKALSDALGTKTNPTSSDASIKQQQQQTPQTTIADDTKAPSQPSPSELTAGARGSVPLGDKQRGTDLSDANLIHTDTPRDEKTEIENKLKEPPTTVALDGVTQSDVKPPIQNTPEMQPPIQTSDAVNPTPATQAQAKQQPIIEQAKPSQLQPEPAQQPLPTPPTDAAIAAAKAEALKWSSTNTKDKDGKPMLTPAEEKDVRCEACCASGKGGHGSAACEAAYDGKDGHCCGRAGFDG